MDVLEIAHEFAKEMVKKFTGLIRCIALFGSQAKGTQRESSDIDIVVIIDDVFNRWDEMVKGWYKEECAKILASRKEFEKIHLNTITLSLFGKVF